MLKLKFILLFCFVSFFGFSQTYTRDGKGIKFIQLEGCQKTSNGTPCDSCFVITSGLNGKLKHCLHISQLRDLILGGNGSIDSVYLVNNSDGSYTLINENDTNYDFGYDFLESGDTLFLTDLAGHKVDYVILKPFQTLSWDPVTGELGISYGNTVIIDVGSGGNGIYGGSDTVPGGTLAYVPLDSAFAIGDFPSFQSTNASDRGVYWFPNNGVRIYGGNNGDGSSNTIGATPNGIDLRSQLGLNSSRIRLSQTLGEYFFNSNKFNVDNDSIYLYGGNEYHNVSALGIQINGDRGADSTVLTSIGGYCYWLPVSGGGGGGGFTLDSVLLKLSGNVMTSKVNTTSDTSLVIGSHTINLSGGILTSQTNGVSDTADISSLLTTQTTNVITQNGNQLTSTVNGVSDTTLTVRSVTGSLSGNTQTININGVTDTVLVIGQNTISYSGSILTSTINGVTDTALIVAGGMVNDVDIDLSGNVMTSDVDGVSDTSVVIGNVTATLSGSVLTIAVNGVSDTAQLSSLVSTTNDLSSSTNTMTSTVNGVSDNATIINSLTHGSTDNDITVTVNGLPASTTIINSNRLVLGNDSLKTQINGIVSNAVPLDSILLNGITNSIGLSGNTITSTVNTISDTCLAIGNNTLSYDSGTSTMTSSINGVTDTAYLGNFNVIQYVDSIKTKIDANSGLFSTGWSLYQDNKAANYISWDSLGYLNYKNGTFSTYAGFPLGVMPYSTTGMNAAKIKVNDSTASNTHYLHVNNKLTGTLIGDHTILNTHWIDTITQSYRSMTAGAASSLQRGLVMDTMGMIGIGLTTAQPQYELDVTGSTRLNGHIYDINNSNGSNGEVLTRTTSGIDWQSPTASAPSVITPAQITVDQTDYNPTGFDGANIVRLSGDSGFRAIQSMAAQTDGEEKTFVNVGSYPLYFPPEHSTGTASQRITYYEDIILMPKKSVKMMYDGTTSRWIPTTDYDVKGCSKVVDYQMNAGSITNGDLDFWSPSISGTAAAFSVGAATSTYPYAYVNGATGSTSSGYAVATMAKTSATSYQALGYISSAHISISADVIIPALSDGTDSFEVFMTMSSTPTTPFTNNGFGIVYSHGSFGGNWTGYTRDGTTTNKQDLGVAVAANTVYHLRAEIDKSRTEVRFYINGAMVGRSAGNIPAANAVASGVGIRKGVGATAKNVYISQINVRNIVP